MTGDEPGHPPTPPDVRFYTDELAPNGLIEETLMGQLMTAAWNLEYIPILQQRLADQSRAEGIDPLLNPAIEKQWDRLNRYLRENRSAYLSLLKQIQKLQTARATRDATGIEAEAAPYADPSAVIRDSRTHMRNQRAAARRQEREAAQALDQFINGPIPGAA